MTLPIERATDQWDLPHTYKPETLIPDSACRCGRPHSDQLHNPSAGTVERSSASGPELIITKGT